MKGSRASPSPSPSHHSPRSGVAERVERVLASKGLTLSEAAREVRLRSAGSPRYLVPHNFYYDLGLPGYSPRIEQVLALSRISNYRLADWLAIFGFNLDDVPRLQSKFPAARTSFLDGTTYERAAWVGWFENGTHAGPPPPVAPLGQFLTVAAPCRADSLLGPEPSPFLYAKIGREDALAFPDLLPGSIVRADTRGIDELLKTMESKDSQRLFLVEHRRGLVCCRLHARTNRSVTLRAGTLPFAQPELRLGPEARVLGVLDWELRPLNNPRPEVPGASMKFLKPQALLSTETQPGLRRLLERARSRCGLSFRKASVQSRWIAEALGDRRYFCAPGSLTDYETGPRLPGHIHKIISLCVLYSVGFWEVLAAAGLDAGDAGREPIPDEFVGRRQDARSAAPDRAAGSTQQRGFLSSLIRDFEEIPLFLRHSLPSLVGLPGLSLRDIFSIGGGRDSLHPYLKDAVLAAVNRRVKRPVFMNTKPLWGQPIYILLLRDGTYLLAGCSIEDRTLVVHPFADGFSRPELLRNNVDAEVVGKVTALFRRLR